MRAQLLNWSPLCKTGLDGEMPGYTIRQSSHWRWQKRESKGISKSAKSLPNMGHLVNSGKQYMASDDNPRWWSQGKVSRTCEGRGRISVTWYPKVRLGTKCHVSLLTDFFEALIT
jgi:hypothetical protein